MAPRNPVSPHAPRQLLIAAVLLPLAAASLAAAHPVTYVNGGAGALVCPPTNPPITLVSPCIGGALIPGDHMAVLPYPPGQCAPAPSCPAETGTNYIFVEDLGSAAVSAVWCQDVDNDNVCGVSEPNVAFCGSLLIQTGTGKYPIPDPWHPHVASRIYLDVAWTGQPIKPNPCGTSVGVAAGSIGVIDHL